jgi:hypothetical protein
MAWSLSGQAFELCNCTALCPCWLGPAKPDQGWCGSAFVFDIDQGHADGVSLAGTRAAFAAEWPADFWSGNGAARVYVDERATPEQRRELEAIFTGKRGGLFGAVLPGIISRWLPTRATRIDVQHGDQRTATVGDVGRVTLSPLKDPTGNATMIQGAAAQAAFQIDRMQVSSARGSRWADGELRPWDGDSGNLIAFGWNG